MMAEANQLPPEQGGPLRSVLVVGGGTAGYFAALALQRKFPDAHVRVVESPKIPVIGVGEATTTAMPVFLHLTLGIDVEELYREVQPTWKLGIRFDWGLAGRYSFMYPFGGSSPVEAMAQDGSLSYASLNARLMEANRSPLFRDDAGQVHCLLPDVKFAYHLHNMRFIGFLARLAKQRGISHQFADVVEVRTGRDGSWIDGLVLSDGSVASADLIVDATGFRSVLLGGALKSPFHSYASTLLCDSAVVAEVPQQGVVEPYTTAETMDAGWCWRIPIEGEDHRGYVYASSFLDPDRALAEMTAKNPGLKNAWHLRFRSGRHQDFWRGNVVAIGNAYGFVEPLESTALHMTIASLQQLTEALAARQPWAEASARVSDSIGKHWDYLRWFLGIHYKYNRRLHTPFWRTARAEVDVSGAEDFLRIYHANGPWQRDGSWKALPPDPIFNHDGLFTLLLGQHAPCPPPSATALSPAAWSARSESLSWLVDRALSQADALAWLRLNPHAHRELVDSKNPSWLHHSLPKPLHSGFGQAEGVDVVGLLDQIHPPIAKH